MASLMKVLVLALTTFMCTDSKRMFLILSHSTMYNGTDLSKPVAVSEFWCYLDRTTSKLSQTIDAIHDSVASLPTVLTVAASDVNVTASDEDEDLPLVYVYNKTTRSNQEKPKHIYDFYFLHLSIWAKK